MTRGKGAMEGVPTEEGKSGIAVHEAACRNELRFDALHDRLPF
jgi:hypothetical protein